MEHTKKKIKDHSTEFGNNLVKKAINVLFDTKLKDIMTGYRVFNKRFVKKYASSKSKI